MARFVAVFGERGEEGAFSLMVTRGEKRKKGRPGRCGEVLLCRSFRAKGRGGRGAGITFRTE